MSTSNTMQDQEHKLDPGPSDSNRMQTLVHRHGEKTGRDFLVAVDGKEVSDAAFQFLAKEVSNSEDTLHVVHAVPEGTDKSESLRILSKYASKCSAEKKHCQLETLFYKGNKEKGIGKSIIQKANEVEACQIVVGHKNSGNPKDPLGSISSYLANRAPCTIVIVKDQLKLGEKSKSGKGLEEFHSREY